MATFNLQVGASPRGAIITKVADGVVEFGKLVVKGTADDDVAETGTTSATPWAVSYPQEHIARENETAAGVAQEQYADDDPCKVMTLVPGMILNLYADGSGIDAGDQVVPSTNGDVAAYNSSNAWEVPMGIALEDISDNKRGQVLITRAGPQ